MGINYHKSVIWFSLESIPESCRSESERSTKSAIILLRGWDIAQVADDLLVKVGIIWSSLHGGCICSLGYFLLQPVVHNWSIKGCGMCCHVCRKVQIKDPLLLIGKSSLCGYSGFPLKKYVKMTSVLVLCNTYRTQY